MAMNKEQIIKTFKLFQDAKEYREIVERLEMHHERDCVVTAERQFSAGGEWRRKSETYDVPFEAIRPVMIAFYKEKEQEVQIQLDALGVEP